MSLNVLYVTLLRMYGLCNSARVLLIESPIQGGSNFRKRHTHVYIYLPDFNCHYCFGVCAASDALIFISGHNVQLGNFFPLEVAL